MPRFSHENSEHRTAQAFQSSLQGLWLLLAIAILAIYIQVLQTIGKGSSDVIAHRLIEMAAAFGVRLLGAALVVISKFHGLLRQETRWLLSDHCSGIEVDYQSGPERPHSKDSVVLCSLRLNKPVSNYLQTNKSVTTQSFSEE